MNIKAIIFDFDGVLAESVDIKTDAFRYLFRDYPAHLESIVRWHIMHGGISRYEKFEYIYKNILKEKLSKKRKRELGKEFNSYVYSAVVACPFVKGAKEFIKKYYKKYKLFIVSGTPDKEIKAITKKRDLKKYFVKIYGSPEKKHILILEILKKYKLEKKDIIFIGDSIDDYLAAKKTSIVFIARVKEGKSFYSLNKKFIISDISALERIINAK